jgi:uncharacterized membrane protein
MVDLIFILHIITVVVLLLVISTYLIDFSCRKQNYSKKYKDVPDSKNIIEEKYKIKDFKNILMEYLMLDA